jgi:hypothetical protein
LSWWLEARLVIDNEDEERRGTDIPRETDEGETLNVFELGESPQFIVRVDMDIFEAWLLKGSVLIFGYRVIGWNESGRPKYV